MNILNHSNDVNKHKRNIVNTIHSMYNIKHQNKVYSTFKRYTSTDVVLVCKLGTPLCVLLQKYHNKPLLKNVLANL